MMKRKNKTYKKSEIIARLTELGLTNIELSYKKSEGWWLTCDSFDDWISMDSGGAMITIERLFNQLKPKEKATKLLAISFNKIADVSNYKGVKSDGGKLFAKIEDIAKKIALDFTDEIIRELKEINGFDAQPRIDFFELVKVELTKI